MNLTPFRNISFRSRLDASEAMERLHAITEAEKFIRIPMFNDLTSEWLQNKPNPYTLS